MTKRKSLILAGALFGMLCIATLGEAATYTVSPSGSNTGGDGSTARPWATLSYACSKVKTAGDTIYLNAGTYNDSVQCVLAPGVNIQGAGKTQTTIYSSLNDFYISAVSVPHASGNQKISGFKLDGNNRTLAKGINITGRSYVTVDNVDFNKIRSNAIKLQGIEWWTNADQDWPAVPPPVYAKGCNVTNVKMTGCSDVNYQASFWVQSVENLLIDNVVIDESVATGGKGNALKSWPGWFRSSTIRNSSFTVDQANPGEIISIEIWNFEKDCEVYNNTFTGGFVSLVSGRKDGGTWALKMHDNTLINTKPFGVAHELSVDDTDFYNNYIVGEALGIWAASHMYNMDGMSNIRVHHNTIYNTNSQGIVLQNGPAAVPFDNIQIYNNVIDTTNRTWPDAGITVSPNRATNFTNVKIMNNIFNNLTYGVYFYGGNSSKVISPRITYNDFFNVTTQVGNDGATSPVISNNLTVDPQFAKTGNRPQYYKLLPTSPLINKGTNVGLTYTGAAPEIGAFELSTIAAPKNLRIVQ